MCETASLDNTNKQGYVKSYHFFTSTVSISLIPPQVSADNSSLPRMLTKQACSSFLALPNTAGDFLEQSANSTSLPFYSKLLSPLRLRAHLLRTRNF